MTHWSEVYACQCGMRFRSYMAEARHRHNFPFLCRAPKKRRKAHKCATGASNLTNSDRQEPVPTETTPQNR